MDTITLNTRDIAPETVRRSRFETPMTLFAGPFVLAALLLSLVLMAFNLWPTFNRMSEWGD